MHARTGVLAAIELSAFAGPLAYQPASVNLLTGPNGSGKSLFLRQLGELIETGKGLRGLSFAESETGSGIIRSISSPISEGILEVRRWFRGFPAYSKTVRGCPHPEGWGLVHVARADTCSLLQHARNNVCLRLGSRRFYLSDEIALQPYGSGWAPQGAALFADQVAERKQFFDWFAEDTGIHLMLDAASMPGKVEMRTGTASMPVQYELSMAPEARAFCGKQQRLAKHSDGIQAYASILALPFMGRRRVIILDEPEAFLSPPLARQLGIRLARLCKERQHQLFAATHSSDFLFGCLMGTEDVSVLRLQYNQGRASCHMVDAGKVRELSRDPLMRTSDVLSGLFYQGTIVTESAADRAFYDQVYHQCREHRSDEGGAAVNFVFAQNAQTVWKIVGPLRDLGSPAGAIVDFDVLLDVGYPWKKLLEAARVPKGAFESVIKLRDQVLSEGRKSDEVCKMLKVGGMAELPANVRDVCVLLLETLRRYGIFVVPVGEMESWFRELHTNRHGPEWVVRIFDDMRNERPSVAWSEAPNSVWSFVAGVVKDVVTLP